MSDGLALRDVRKRYGATLALDDAGLDARAGTVHALLGENGAGKTTMMRIAFGLVRADAGEVIVGGRPLRLHSTADAIAAGIGMVHQHFMLVPALTVAENVALGGRGRFDAVAAAARVRDVARDAGLALDPDARVRDLPVAAQQRLEIVKALAREARILILDEPTAVLAPDEAHQLHAWLRRFAAGGGTAIVITHRLQEALAVADELTVLRRGRTVFTRATTDADADDVVAALTGDPNAQLPRPVQDSTPTRDVEAREPVLALRAASYVDAQGIRRLDDVTVEVRAGEILGVIGVEGSGEHELLRLLAGRLEPTSGSVRHPAIVGFIPVDRVNDALVPSLSLTENFALAGAGVRRGRVDWPAMRERTSDAIAEFGVRATGPGQRAAELSGGNQQRFVVARERATAPMALVAENPTRGLDIRATALVARELEDARAAGAAVVLYSSDLEEVLALATRVVACHAGRVRGVEPPADPADRTPYTRAIAGLS